ncbi:hypothetical protein QQS21_007404 [Conoideocrella luteorostrata]|uniref:Uncharacterized protein n=1 Tax=Conoideocrella luteorostrata TaxID=1105319 RepID=A0AAJ0CKT2_9HYPO|nr:hypothetical protein QQS21_007404 [Conoideocrella luteorostrata]
MKHSTLADFALLSLIAPFGLVSARVVPEDVATLPRGLLNDVHSSDGVYIPSRQSRRQAEQAPTEPLQVVYRGDTRSPSELRALGGIPTEFGGPVKNESYGLYEHHTAACDNGACLSAYTSTARAFGSALMFGADFGKADGWVYKIHATPNMIDMDNSGFKLKYFYETEFSALGGVRWDQIEAWVPAPRSTNKLLAGLPGRRVDLMSWEKFQQERNQEWPKQWINNTEYNKKYDNYKSSGGQPQLAKVDQNGKTSLEHEALEFMQKNGKAVGWDSSSKSIFLNLNETIPKNKWTGPHKLDDKSPSMPQLSIDPRRV